MVESILSKIKDALGEFVRIFPVLIILVVSIYALNSSARQTIDSFILSTPAKGLVSAQYDNYPAFLDSDDIVVKKTTFNDSGQEVEGLIIEIHNPGALAKTSTTSMQPMFGPGNLIVQEEVTSSTKLNLGDIVIYENSEGELIIHQIIGYENGCYSTKGLNNPAADDVCVTQDMVKFRMLFAIPTK
jgi:hypothetical protein